MTPQEELKLHLGKMREAYADIVTLADALQVPVNASAQTECSLYDIVRPFARDIVARLDTLDQLSGEATDEIGEPVFVESNWYIPIAIGALYDHWACHAKLVMEPLRTLQGRKASRRMLDKIWADMMLNYQHLDKIINLIRNPVVDRITPT